MGRRVVTEKYSYGRIYRFRRPKLEKKLVAVFSLK